MLLCSVCGDNFTEIANLQHHILKNHCMQSGPVAEALKMHLQLLNTVLTNQSAIEQNIGKITKECSIEGAKESDADG